MKLNIRYTTFLFLLFSCNVFAQSGANVFITAPPGIYISSTIGTFGCHYNLPIPGSSNLYALGIVWSTSPTDLNFKERNYSNPTQRMKYINLPNPNGGTIVIGDGLPSARGMTNATEALKPNTVYWARAFLFATLCTEYKNGPGCTKRKKGVWYSQTIMFRTPGVQPISNNVLTSPSQVICSGGAAPVIKGSTPQGGTGSYTYQWQSKVNGTGMDTARWRNIADSTRKDLKPAKPSSQFSGTVTYRRLVRSGSLADTLRTSPVVYTFMPSTTDFTLTLSRHYSSADRLTLEAALYPEVAFDSITWLKSTSESGPYSVIAGQELLSYTTDTAGTFFYKAVVVPGIGCATDTSRFVALSNKDGSGYKYLYTKIGGRYWTIENSKATRLNNGSSIAIVTDSTWKSSISPSYCFYNNDSAANFKKFGLLYNYYVNENVCPAGWKVPSKSNWSALVDSTGGYTIAGSNLSTTNQNYWPDSAPNRTATNKFNFNALPGGFRHGGTSAFLFMNIGGRFWSLSNINDPAQADYFGVTNNLDNTTMQPVAPQYGLSIRCIKK